MVWLVGALLLLWVALGPVVLVLAAALLGGPRGSAGGSKTAPTSAVAS